MLFKIEDNFFFIFIFYTYSLYFIWKKDTAFCSFCHLSTLPPHLFFLSYSYHVWFIYWASFSTTHQSSNIRSSNYSLSHTSRQFSIFLFFLVFPIPFFFSLFPTSQSYSSPTYLLPSILPSSFTLSYPHPSLYLPPLPPSVSTLHWRQETWWRSISDRTWTDTSLLPHTPSSSKPYQNQVKYLAIFVTHGKYIITFRTVLNINIHICNVIKCYRKRFII